MHTITYAPAPLRQICRMALNSNRVPAALAELEKCDLITQSNLISIYIELPLRYAQLNGC